MGNIRFRALEDIHTRPAALPLPENKNIAEIFGQYVFDHQVIREYLSSELYEEFILKTEHGQTLGRHMADAIANAMKMWAQKHGASHYTHWFQPLTGLTAEKHDSFFTLKNGQPIERFSGDQLIQQEPDASSLPSGGIRNTFEARGYTAWDPSSPAFIFENKYGKTLCIPTIFVSYTGEALDYKAPLLKSIAFIEDAAVNVCRLFDRSVTKVWPTLGVEQEYFLVDRNLFDLRPDLLQTGRTLMGAAPAKGQQLEDHYFGSIPERVFGFMKEFETEAYKLGIPLTTRHNEVAPSQFECAPIFEEQNIAIDHNQLLMDLIERVAKKHKFQALMHEKPFAGINGSGKHNNWSLVTNTGKNLLSPGNNPKDNLQFLTFVSCIVKAVYEHADLLRAGIASASNDLRLGANEAPPAIISVFIGSQLTQILDDLIKPNRKKSADTPKSYLKLGIPKVPEILRDNTDRNRTSPFAFTGNKFEFRAVGSSSNCAPSNIILNTIVGNQLVEFYKTVERKTTRGKKKEQAILEVVKDYIKSSKDIRFEGNGYSQEWVDEAAKRGLSNIPKTPAALDAYVSEKTVGLFEQNHILTEKELHARHDIKLDNYIKKIQIEARVLGDLARNHVLPPAFRYLNVLTTNINQMKAAGMKAASWKTQEHLAERISNHANVIYEKVDEMIETRKKVNNMEDTRDRAIAYAEKITPYFDEIRYHIDKLEALVDDDMWTLPKYREMLLVR